MCVQCPFIVVNIYSVHINTQWIDSRPLTSLRLQVLNEWHSDTLVTSAQERQSKAKLASNKTLFPVLEIQKTWHLHVVAEQI